MTMGARVVGYIRVSTEGQADEGISLAARRAKLEAYALAMDLELIAIHEDAGLSAKTVSGRPGLLQALADFDEGGADGILIAKLDRLTRSVRDLGDWFFCEDRLRAHIRAVGQHQCGIHRGADFLKVRCRELEHACLVVVTTGVLTGT